MKRRILLIIALVIILALPFLSSCEPGELDEIIYAAKLWAMVHDITDEDGEVNYGAATRFGLGNLFGFGSTGDKEGDAAIDSVKALNAIRQADEEADEGWNQLYGGHNVQDTVLPHYNAAVNLRKNDWTYRNDRGIAYLNDLNDPKNVDKANDDFDAAMAMARKSGKPVEYLRMLKQREQSMARLVRHQREEHSLPTGDMLREQLRTYTELYALTKDNNYLLLQQQVDTDIQEGYYWRVETDK